MTESATINRFVISPLRLLRGPIPDEWSSIALTGSLNLADNQLATQRSHTTFVNGTLALTPVFSQISSECGALGGCQYQLTAEPEADRFDPIMAWLMGMPPNHSERQSVHWGNSVQPFGPAEASRSSSSPEH